MAKCVAIMACWHQNSASKRNTQQQTLTVKCDWCTTLVERSLQWSMGLSNKQCGGVGHNNWSHFSSIAHIT